MAANTEYTKIKESTISSFFSKLKAAFWPKNDVVNVNLANVAVTGDYNDLSNKPSRDNAYLIDPSDISNNYWPTTAGSYSQSSDEKFWSMFSRWNDGNGSEKFEYDWIGIPDAGGFYKFYRVIESGTYGYTGDSEADISCGFVLEYDGHRLLYKYYPDLAGTDGALTVYDLGYPHGYVIDIYKNNEQNYVCNEDPEYLESIVIANESLVKINMYEDDIHYFLSVCSMKSWWESVHYILQLTTCNFEDSNGDTVYMRLVINESSITITKVNVS